MPGYTNKVTPADTFEHFVGAINAHDIDALSALMSPEHIFVDSLGNRIQGVSRMEAGWRGYFTLCPDYAIQIENFMSELDTVLAVGQVGSTIDGVAWRTPAAWKAIVHAGEVVDLHVFADNKPVYEILTRRKP